MCEPVTASVIGGSLSLAGSAAQYLQGSAQASATNAQNEERARANRTLAMQSANAAYGATDARVQEEATRAGLTATQITRDAMEARATATVSAAQSGVKGASVDALMQEFERQEGESLTINALQKEYLLQQAEREKQETQRTQQGRWLAAQPPIVEGPSLFGASLSGLTGAVGTGLSIYDQLKVD